VNHRIRTPEVRIINHEGQMLGVMPTFEALRLAEAAGLDLVEVSPKAVPPVCKIMDFGRFKYEKAKQAKEARKHQSVIQIKEVKFRPKTDEHDLDFKVKKIIEFLSEGNKVKLVVQFRGREIVHPETGQVVLQRIINLLSEQANIEQMPSMEGRRMNMMIGPRVGVIRHQQPRILVMQQAPAAPPPTTTAAPAPRAVAVAAAPGTAPVADGVAETDVPDDDEELDETDDTTPPTEEGGPPAAV
jgi:translation initiation factor IF-3